MAVTPANQDAFFREVDEELRRDQLGSFWRRYARWIIVGALLALVAVAGFLYWQHRQQEAANSQAETLTGALADLGDSKEAPARAALARLAAADDGAYSVAARLTQAGVALTKNDRKAAAAGFRAVADDGMAAKPFRDLALLRGTAVEFDTLAPQQVIDRLKPLAVPGGSWFGSAGEMTAIAFLRLNKPQQAGALFAQIARDKSVPETLRARAVRISGVLGVDAVAGIGEATKE